MDKKAVFKELLDNFETEEVRLYCEDMIENINKIINDKKLKEEISKANKVESKKYLIDVVIEDMKKIYENI